MLLVKPKINRNSLHTALAAGIIILAAVVAFLALRPQREKFGKIATETVYEDCTDFESFLSQAKRQLLRLRENRDNYRYLILGGTPFEIGGASMGKAWFYLNHPLLDDHPQWELAVSSRAALEEVKIEDIGCRFFQMNDAEGAAAFGNDWNGHAVRIPERRIVFIRAMTNRTVTYAIELVAVGRGRGVTTNTVHQLYRGRQGRPWVKVRHLRIAQPDGATPL